MIIIFFRLLFEVYSFTEFASLILTPDDIFQFAKENDLVTLFFSEIMIYFHERYLLNFLEDDQVFKPDYSLVLNFVEKNRDSKILGKISLRLSFFVKNQKIFFQKL